MWDQFSLYIAKKTTSVHSPVWSNLADRYVTSRGYQSIHWNIIGSDSYVSFFDNLQRIWQRNCNPKIQANIDINIHYQTKVQWYKFHNIVTVQYWEDPKAVSMYHGEVASISSSLQALGTLPRTDHSNFQNLTCITKNKIKPRSWKCIWMEMQESKLKDIQNNVSLSRSLRRFLVEDIMLWQPCLTFSFFIFLKSGQTIQIECTDLIAVPQLERI